MEEDFYEDISTEDEIYVVNGFDNKKRPEEKQMQVVVKQFSGSDLNYIARKTANTIVERLKGSDLKRGTDVWTKEYMNLYNMEVKKWEFVYRIKELINFKFKVGKDEKVFTDAEELFEYPNKKIAKIVEEIMFHFEGFDKLDLKNL